MDLQLSPVDVNAAQISLNHGAVGTKLIRVNVGEDIVYKIMDFSQQEEMKISIQLTGEVCSVTLQEESEMDRNIVTHEGRFLIMSLSLSFMVSESSRICGLHMVLSRPDRIVFCGYVFGRLIAATPLEVVVSSFIPKKEESEFGGYDDN
uniref:AT-hook motif nuclear-localized protein n=1 Tax=Solanum lycopersicum TaxID=4081 RepID=A0A3Q7G4K7_SOLLC